MERTPQVLICDDDRLIHDTFRLALKGTARCRSAYNSDETLAILRNHPIDLVLLDVQMRTSQEGLQAIPKLKAVDPTIEIVMVSGVSDFKIVREAMRLGAIDYVSKGAEPGELNHVIERALARRALNRQCEQKDYETQSLQSRHALIGKSPQVQALLKNVDKIRHSSANVVITGETGAGKEVVARMLRKILPGGALAPFQSIDSSTIQSTMAESILFGHEVGAFTGAHKVTKGIFEEADGGAVYFDEIANMPLSIQTKLLRVIQEKEITRLGSVKLIPLEFRVICATNRNLESLVQAGQFQEDLLQRLNVLPIEVPPLRERAEDIPLLLAHFAQLQAPGRPIRFTEDALELLMSYRWPGNIRELGNMIAYVLTMTDGDEIDLADLPKRLRDRASQAEATPGGSSFYEQVAAFERDVLVKAYSGGSNNISRIALDLGMDRSHLYSKLKEHGIHQPKSKG